MIFNVETNKISKNVRAFCFRILEGRTISSVRHMDSGHNMNKDA